MQTQQTPSLKINSDQLAKNPTTVYPLNGDDLPQLTDEEILEYRIQKKYRLEREAKQAQYAQKLLQPIHPTITTAEEFITYCQQRTGRTIIIDQDNAQVINTLAHYFAGLDTHLDPQKGILLYGNVGTGKTTLMQIMQEAPHASFAIRDVQDIVNEYKASGVEAIEKYGRLIQNNTPTRYFATQEVGLCIDDVGTESEASSYGNKTNLITEILSMRYRNLNGPYTHIITNLTPQQLQEAYGERVFDRLYEMFNVVQFPHTAQSRRKRKNQSLPPNLTTTPLY